MRHLGHADAAPAFEPLPSSLAAAFYNGMGHYQKEMPSCFRGMPEV